MSKDADTPGEGGQTGELAPPPGQKPDLKPHAPPMDPNAGQTGELATQPPETGRERAD